MKRLQTGCHSESAAHIGNSVRVTNPIECSRIVCLSIALLLLSAAMLHGSDLDTIGVTLLRKFDPTLQGTGIRIAQVEAPLDTNSPPPFEVNPSTVGQPTNLFSYYSSLSNSSTFPNEV